MGGWARTRPEHGTGSLQTPALDYLYDHAGCVPERKAPLMEMTDGADAAIKRESLSKLVADAVLTMIVERPYRPGEALPSTGELSGRFKVSRTVVREALADLAGRGLIDRGQGRESVVALPGAGQLSQLFELHMFGKDLDADSLTEFRMAIEMMAARLAAGRHEATDLELMQAALDDMAGASDQDSFHEADIRFHHAVAAASGNSLFRLVFDSLVDLLRQRRAAWFMGRRRRGRDFAAVTDEHRRVFDAIVAGNEEEAARAMGAHLTASLEDLGAGIADSVRS